MPDLTAGYEVTITRRDRYDGMTTCTDYLVVVKRLSDGQELERVFDWRWAARRWARSTRRLGKAFRRAAAYRDGQVETFTIGWRD